MLSVKAYRPIANRKISRDPKDDYLLIAAEELGVNFLVTGDQDLLVLHPFKGIQVLSFRDFLIETNLA